MTQITQRTRRLTILAAAIIAAALSAALTVPAAQAATPVYTGHAFGPEGISSSGQPEGTFTNLQSVAVEQTSGDVYVYAGGEGGRIYRFNAEGEPVEFSALHSNAIENVGEPYYHEPAESEIAVSSSGATEGDIYFVNDNEGRTVTIYGPEGDQVGELNSGVEAKDGLWGEACGVAVDPQGNVYVALYDVGVDKFTPSSATVEDSDYVSSLWGISEPECAIAANSAEDLYASYHGGEGAVSEYEASQFQTGVEYKEKGEVPASSSEVDAKGGTVAVDPATSELYVDEVKAIAQYESSGTRLDTFGESGAGALSGSYGVAIDHATGQVYANNETTVEIFGAASAAPTATIKPVSAIGQNSATLNGEVDPEGTPTTYHFEYSIDQVHWTVLPEESAGDTSAEVPVSYALSGLTGNTTYYVRLVAKSVGGHETSGEESFTTTAGPPQILNVGATGVLATEATLRATIDPENQPATSYRFEYGTTTAYGTIVPAGEGNIGATSEAVAQTLTSLAPDTTYHYRVVASNGVGAPTVTADHTFTTYPSLITTSCSNEQKRSESSLDPVTGQPFSLALPECRAYEMVTPSFKSIDDVTDQGAGTLTGASIEQDGISTDGSQILVRSVALLGAAGADEELNPTEYEVTRGESGWSTTSLTPAASIFPVSTDEVPNPANVSEGLWSASTPAQAENAVDFYLREADGSFQQIGPLAPPSSTTGPARGASPHRGGVSYTKDGIVGASANLADVVFQIASPDTGAVSYLWPGDATEPGELPSLYEYVGRAHTGEAGDRPALVGVDNDETQISKCGTGLGAESGAGIADIKTAEVRSAAPYGVSAAGSTVLFTAQHVGASSECLGGINELYARIGLPGSTQATVNVAGSSGCATSVSCDVASPVTYQGSSKDGSKVFFTAAQAGLVSGDSDATNSLYECELPGDGGATPTATGDVDACPVLKALSQTGTSEGAEVQSVVAVSEEGSRVYYIAKGELSSTPNEQGVKPEAGKDNLYLYEAPSSAKPAGRTVFIATLPTASLTEAQATPSGEYIVFTTPADLTPDDTSSVAQAFRYDATSSELVRISIGQGGFNEAGNTNEDPATLASGSLGRRTISQNGALVVFQSSDALTAKVVGGKDNVYVWRDGEVHLISDGIDSQSPAEPGISPGKVGLIAMDATGENVFFTTSDKLVGQDTDEDIDLYDARIDGGFAAPTHPPSCSGEACQGPLTSSLGPIGVGSGGLPAVGNLKSTKSVKKTGKVRITKHRLEADTIVLSVKTPAKGKLTASGKGLKETSKSVKASGSYRLKVKLTKAERKKLKRKKKLKLKVKVAFKPASGKSSSATATVTVKK